MIEYFTKYKVHIIIGVAMFAALVFYSLNLRQKEKATAFERAVLTVFSPLHSGMAGVTGFFGSIWSDYIFLVDAEHENKLLRKTVKQLNARLILAGETVRENQRLKTLLELKEELNGPSVAATVVGEDSSPWFKTLIINKGERDGLKEGMPVVATGGVVGQVVKVASTSSRVLLLTDHSCAVAAVIQRSRARGVVKGKGDNLCSMEFTVREDDVKPGDIVVTSGIGGIFPKGLLIGEVTMVRKGQYGIFQTINIRPGINLARIEDVLILLRRPYE